jgi:hypothetical protein
MAGEFLRRPVGESPVRTNIIIISSPFADDLTCSANVRNQLVSRRSERKVPLNDSQKALSLAWPREVDHQQFV